MNHKYKIEKEIIGKHTGRIIIASNATDGNCNPSLELAKEKQMSMPIFIRIDTNQPLANVSSTSITIAEAKEIIECLTSMVEFLEDGQSGKKNLYA